MDIRQKTTWFEKQAPNISEQLSNFGDAVYEGKLDQKTRELIAVASSCVLRCGHCTKGHIQGAKNSDVTQEEISEALMVTALITSGTQLFWMGDDYEQLLGSDDKNTPWFIEQAGNMGKQWKSFHDTVLQTGALSQKVKELIAVAVACLSRCHFCTRTHINEAQKQEADKQEITEALMIAAYYSATTQLMWMSDDYQELLG